jgi:hypothetical protein
MSTKSYLFVCLRLHFPVRYRCDRLSSVSTAASLISGWPYCALIGVSDLVLDFVLDQIYHPAGQHNSGIIPGCHGFARDFGSSMAAMPHNLAHGETWSTEKPRQGEDFDGEMGEGCDWRWVLRNERRNQCQNQENSGNQASILQFSETSKEKKENREKS